MRCAIDLGARLGVPQLIRYWALYLILEIGNSRRFSSSRSLLIKHGRGLDNLTCSRLYNESLEQGVLLVLSRVSGRILNSATRPSEAPNLAQL